MLPTMPSKLRKAFGAVKDQTSISLAKVSSTNAGANLEVLILRATTHDEIPINERYVNEILLLVSSDKAHAAACAQAISKRLGKTRNWIVALKSLMLVLRTFQDGDPYFPKEVLHAMKRGAKILNLSSFRDDSNSSPWDYTAFVRTFALYLDERLDCFLTGKLQRRVTYRQRESIHQRTRLVASPVRDMKPAMLLDRISYWQRLIDRAIATRPTGEARTNRLIQISLHAIVQESFDLYRDISEGLALLLDSFFHLQYQSCVSAFQSCVKATKQFRQLSSFYDFCKSIGVGRTSEYPSVQKISEELIETLQDFLRDQASFPSHHARISPLLLPAPPAPRNDRPKNRGSSSERFAYDQSELAPERLSQSRGFGSRSRCTSLEDLMSMTGVSPSMNIEQHEEKQPTLEDFISVNDDSGSPLEQGASSGVNEEKQEPEKKTLESLGLELESQKDGWELVLFESTETQQVQPSTNLANGFEPSVGYSLPQHQYNPFLQDMVEAAPTFQAAATAVVAPTFYTQSETMAAAPTFVANNPQETISAIFQKENDPFDAVGDEHVCNGNEKSVLDEQQLWLENQNRIIAKHMG